MGLAKTDRGHQVLKDRSVALTPRQRSAFILVDGRRTFEQVLAATAPMGVTRQDIERLIELELVADAAPPIRSFPAETTTALQMRTPQQRYQAAYPIAVQLTSSLGSRGSELNLAVEGAGSFEELLQIAPRIREAVGPAQFARLDAALHGP